MKKIFILLLGLIFCNTCLAQRYEIIGKGETGQTPCGGYIYVFTQGQESYEIKIEIDDIQNKSWDFLRRKIINERTVAFFYAVDFRLPGDKSEPKPLIYMQKCDINPNVYFFVLPKLFGDDGTEIYKTRKINWIDL